MSIRLNIDAALLEDIHTALDIDTTQHLDQSDVDHFLRILQDVAAYQERGEPIPNKTLAELDVSRHVIAYAAARYQAVIHREEQTLQQTFFNPATGFMESAYEPDLEGFTYTDVSAPGSQSFDFCYVEDTNAIPPVEFIGFSIDVENDCFVFEEKSNQELATEALARINAFAQSIPEMAEISFTIDDGPNMQQL